jgi:beta-glucosidase
MKIRLFWSDRILVFVGLSFTSFNYSDLITTPHSREITVTVLNTGPQAGATIVQLYLCFPSAAGEPPLQLKGFEKVWLIPGQRATVQFYLKDRDVSTWDDVQHKWAVQTGDFVVMVGESSVDLPLRSTLKL